MSEHLLPSFPRGPLSHDGLFDDITTAMRDRAKLISDIPPPPPGDTEKDAAGEAFLIERSFAERVAQAPLIAPHKQTLLGLQAIRLHLYEPPDEPPPTTKDATAIARALEADAALATPAAPAETAPLEIEAAPETPVLVDAALEAPIAEAKVELEARVELEASIAQEAPIAVEARPLPPVRPPSRPPPGRPSARPAPMAPPARAYGPLPRVSPPPPRPRSAPPPAVTSSAVPAPRSSAPPQRLATPTPPAAPSFQQPFIPRAPRMPSVTIPMRAIASHELPPSPARATARMAAHPLPAHPLPAHPMTAHPMYPMNAAPPSMNADEPSAPSRFFGRPLINALVGATALLGALALAIFFFLPKQGSLEVDVVDAEGKRVRDALVLVDHEPKCASLPCVVSHVERGARVVEVTAAGYEAAAPTSVEVDGGHAKRVQIALKSAR